MKPFLEELRARLDALRSDGLHRELRLPEGIDFASNDYLGISVSERLRGELLEALRTGPLGSPASRLLRGNTAEHVELERRLAAFKGMESALLFPSGYQANLALLGTLIKQDDIVVSDEANHASIRDGLRMSGARVVTFPHLDVGAMEGLLRDPPAADIRKTRVTGPRNPGARGRTFVVTESLFSMDGDIAPLDRYAELAEAGGAGLIVDDAHATGVYGDARGSGLVERFGVEDRTVAVVSTCGKALGIAGAFVAGPGAVVEYLVNRARPFIFSTAVPPLLLRAIDASLRIVATEPGRRRRVLDLAERLRGHLRARGIDCLRSEGPIVPVLLERNERAVAVADGLRRRGFDVRAVRPPAVPPRTARLRISVHAERTEDEIDRLARAVEEEIRASGGVSAGAAVGAGGTSSPGGSVAADKARGAP